MNRDDYSKPVGSLLSGGVGLKPHRSRPVLLRDLDMIRNALKSLPTEGALYELTVIRSRVNDALIIQLRLDEPPTIVVEIDDAAETLPILPKS